MWCVGGGTDPSSSQAALLLFSPSSPFWSFAAMNREAPEAAPPPYALQRYRQTQTNLRPVTLIVAFFAGLWGIIVGAAYLRNRNDVETPASLDTVYLALAIVYFVCVAIEAFGFFAAWKATIQLVRPYFWVSVAAAVLVTGAELVRTIFHFTHKSAIIKACVDSYNNDVANGTSTAANVSDYCNASWSNSSYVDLGLLIFTFIVAFLFASVVASFLHQLKNPQALRTHNPQVASSAQYAYPLHPYPGGAGAPPYPASTNPYAVPPPNYGGGPELGHLPSYDNPYGVSASDDKLPPPHPPAENPFADSVEHAHAEPVRREGESGDEFERRQHEWNVRRYGESTETVTLGPRV